MRPLAKVLCFFSVFAVAWGSTQVRTAARGGRAESPSPALLEVLRETGQMRGDVPVFDFHPDAHRYIAGLTRGFSGRLLRLYALEQHYLQVRNGTPIEPAYLLLSHNMGGFPRFGFYLGARDKRTAGYVDLEANNRNVRVGGSFGAMDQIFPHELGHVIVTQLSGPPRHGGSNQMHAIGVRTDQFNAFSEGFAEHLQVMALDDPDALAETRELLRDGFFERRASMQLREYAQEIEGWWPLPGRRRVAFPFWFSNNEQALRYYAVKRNLFAHQVDIPARLLRADPYGAYLLENILPGRPENPPRSASQLVSTEGFVAALFVRWMTDAQIQNVRREPAFYEAFGVSTDAVTPLENAYLKLFHAFFVSRPADVREAVEGYKACFPDEASEVDRVVCAASLGRSLDAPQPIWLANDEFHVGTTMFDQFRSIPRVHTFDLNAASMVDLVAVRGVDRGLAEAIRRKAPYRSIEGLRAVAGIDRALMQRFRDLEKRATSRAENGASEESSLSLWGILKPYVWRLAALVLVAAVLGAAAYRLAVPLPWPRAIVNGLAASILACFAEIALDFPPGILGIVVPVLFLGIPAVLYCLLFPRRTARRVAARRQLMAPPSRGSLAVAVLFAWLLAALPLVLIITPHF